MMKESKPLEIEQVFSKTQDGAKRLQRLVVYDNNLAYDLILDEKSLSVFRLMSCGLDGVFYEIASKEKGKPCVKKYHMASCEGTIYENKNMSGNSESVVALTYAPDGTVRAGLALFANMKGFNVLHNRDHWASFLLTPQGVQYVQDIDRDLSAKPQDKKVISDDQDVVIIDGRKVFPVDRNTHILKGMNHRQGGRG